LRFVFILRCLIRACTVVVLHCQKKYHFLGGDDQANATSAGIPLAILGSHECIAPCEIWPPTAAASAFAPTPVRAHLVAQIAPPDMFHPSDHLQPRRHTGRILTKHHECLHDGDDILQKAFPPLLGQFGANASQTLTFASRRDLDRMACRPADCSNVTFLTLEPYGDISGPGVRDTNA
jgi:hypothetical protein